MRVYYEDTDAGGVVYYANYLRFFERCRTEWMRSMGFGQRELADREGVLFVVAAAEVKFLRPARLDDELLVDARIAERFCSYVVFEQTVWRGAQVLCHSRMKVACVDAQTLRPTRLPPALAAALAPKSDPPHEPGANSARP
jgi:acyl-CoA thioester hydrolase